MIFLYRLLYVSLKFFAIHIVSRFSLSVQKWCALRSHFKSQSYQLKTFQKSIWFHASSGEIEYAKPLIRLLKKNYPNMPITVTYSSFSAENLFFNIQKDVDLFCPVPWDSPSDLQLWIQKTKPLMLIFSRTDLWPEMIQTAKKNKIPIGLIAYYPKLNFFTRRLMARLLKHFNFVSCVNVQVQKSVAEILSARHQVAVGLEGDTRFDQVFSRLQQKPVFNWTSSKKIGLTLGSTWPEDEQQINQLIPRILEQNKLVVYCPHDVSKQNVEQLKLKIESDFPDYKDGIKFFSKEISNQNLSDTFKILIVDQIGVLADFYRHSEVAFVGGSFRSRVHSVMEPLAAGCPVLVGPLIQNSPEALLFSSPQALEPYVFVAETAEDLILHYDVLQSMDLTALHKKIQNHLLAHQGSSEKIRLTYIDKILEKAKF